MSIAENAESHVKAPHPRRVVALLGAAQILGWGTIYYLPAVLALPIAKDMAWPLAVVVGGLSWGLLVSSLMAPHIGQAIDRYGGRYVLAASSILFALGLLILSVTPNLIIYYIAWTMLGCGMAAGLYDAAFATLGRYFGAAARPSITGITLIAGFASTIAWPVLTTLHDSFGWRGVCLVLVPVHLLIGLPIYRFLLPAASPLTKPDMGLVTQDRPLILPPEQDFRFVLLAFTFTVFAFIASSVSVHILTILQRLNLESAIVVLVGMVIGPSQVFARLAEFFVGRYVHPIFTGRSGLLLCFAGIGSLASFGSIVAIPAMILYGAGNGLMTIARGTAPLALFGSHGYGKRVGLIARPMLIAQATAPVILAQLLDHYTAQTCLMICTALTAIALIGFLILRIPRKEASTVEGF